MSMIEAAAAIILGFLVIVVALHSFLIVMILRSRIRAFGTTAEARSALFGPALHADAPVVFGLTIRSGKSRPSKLIVFASTSCPACQHAIDELAKLPSVDSLAMNVISRGTAEDVREFTMELPQHIGIFADEDGSALRAWNIQEVPFAVVVGGEGRIEGKTAVVNRASLTAVLAQSIDDSSAVKPPRVRAVARSIVGIIFLGGIAGCDPSVVKESEFSPIHTPIAEGAVELELGTSESQVFFGSVEGIELTSDSAFVVVDAQLRTVSYFSANGDLRHTFGGTGEGPFEFSQPPCCPAIDEDGLLWILQVGNPGRFRAFALTASGVEDSTTIWVNAHMSYGDIAFPESGVIEGEYLPQRKIPGQGRIQVSRDGYEVARFYQDALPPDSVGGFWVGGDRLPIYPPFTPNRLYATARDGTVASVNTSSYSIEVRSPAGSLDTITSLIQGPRLSTLERDSSEERMERILRSLRGEGWTVQEVAIPERKPVIRDLWYDGDKRLWVHLFRTDGEILSRAHVYGQDGALLFEARWPRDVHLFIGDARRMVAMGVRLNELDVQSVVKLRFRLSEQ